jgi:hypothetical protein
MTSGRSRGNASLRMAHRRACSPLGNVHQLAETPRLAKRDRATAPFDHVLDHRPLSAGRRSASRTRPPSRSASAVSTAAAKPSSRRSRSARFFRSTAWASKAERRDACLTDLLTQHISSSIVAPPSAVSSCRRLEGHHRRSRPASRTPNRFQIRCARHLAPPETYPRPK